MVQILGMFFFSVLPDRWNVTVRTTDSEGLFIEEKLSFAILDVNDKPRNLKVLVLNGYPRKLRLSSREKRATNTPTVMSLLMVSVLLSFSPQLSRGTLPENIAPPALVGSLTVEDDDANQTLTMSLIDTSHDRFTLHVTDQSTYELWVGLRIIFANNISRS